MTDSTETKDEIPLLGDDGELLSQQPMSAIDKPRLNPFRWLWRIWLLAVVCAFGFILMSSGPDRLPRISAVFLAMGLSLCTRIATASIGIDRRKKGSRPSRYVPEEIRPSLYRFEPLYDFLDDGRTKTRIQAIREKLWSVLVMTGYPAIWVGIWMGLLNAQYQILEKSSVDSNGWLSGGLSLLIASFLGLLIKFDREKGYIQTHGILLFGWYEADNWYPKCVFMTPGGEILSKHTQGDKSWGIPPDGTPVAILYVNKGHYEVL